MGKTKDKLSRRLRVGDTVLFLKSGKACRIVSVHDDKTFTVVRIDTGKEMIATVNGLEEMNNCNCCDRPIKPGREVWLEYDNITDLYHRLGEVPEGGESLGVYPFGVTCARKETEATDAHY